MNTATNQVEVYATNTNPPRQTAIIKTEATPLAAAMSRSGRYLYVACYDASALDVVDLASATFSTQSVTLAAKPQAVAVGFNEKVLISTIGTGQGQAVLITFDPTVDVSRALQAIVVAPPAPTTPQMPPPNGVMYLAGKSRLQATQDGRTIIGVNEPNATTRTIFVFDVVSSIVLSSRSVAANSPILAVAPDGSNFLSGPMLFRTSSLLMLAQQNATNSPYVFPAGANFNVQTAQGGAVYAQVQNSLVLITAYNVVPVASPAARSITSQLMINTPDNLLIQLGIQLPENLSGKMVITSDSATIYALSQSGFMVLPIGTLQNSPIARPDANVALLASDQCGVTAALNSAVIPVRNLGGGRITVTAQAVTAAATSPALRVTSRTYGGDVTAQYSATVTARGLGTVAPDQLLIQSTEAVNIIPNVRVFQNSRNAESRGTILPVDTGAGTAGLTDMVADTARQRLYIANPGLNRIEVFDMQRRVFLAPITVGQLPRSMAFGSDGNTLYVANSGAEFLSVVDLNLGAATGHVDLPAIPMNATFTPLTPAIVAFSQRGPQVLMSDGTLWRVVGNTLSPRALNTNVFGTARSVPAPQTMASSPDGSYVLLLAGNGAAFLYSAIDDDFVSARQVIPTPIQGYYGPVAVGPNGQYYLVNDQVLNQALTPIGEPSGITGPVSGGTLPAPNPTAAARPVSAVAALGAQSFARFSMPVRASAAAVTADAGVIEVVDVASQRTTAAANSLEGPLAAVAAGGRANISGRTMVADPSGSTVYVLTASGLSIIPVPAAGSQNVPQLPANGVVSTASYQPSVAPGGLISIFGRNLAGNATAPSGAPLPYILGATCVTLNNTPLPLLASSAAQINAQLPPTLAAGRYSLVVRSIAAQEASGAASVTVSKYAPAVFVDEQGPAIFHQDGTRVARDRPAKRDEPLAIYATGLGTTTGGRVTAGSPAPSNPLAVTAPVLVFFGNPLIKEAGVIVDWSGLLPGAIGVYQINCRVPGAHLKGDALPVTLRIGAVNSPTTGVTAPTVSVE